MQKIEVVVRITKDHCPPQEQTIFEWFDLMRNPTDALSRPDLEINLEHHRVFKHGTEVYMSRYEYGVLSLMAQHPGKLFTKEQIFEAVWHKDSESYLRAVTNTIGRIRQKIEDDKDHPRYIKTVSNIGYMPSKRSHGEGTLRHRSDGRWELRMMDGYQKDGSPRFKTFYGKTQKEVKLKLKEYQDALISGVQLDTILYFEDWADTWFEGHRDNIAPTTQESYKYCLKMLKEGFYHRPLTVIRPIDIENFLKGMRRDGRSDSYISKARGMLYQIFQKAEANDLVRRNPVRLAEKMRASGTAKRKEAFTTAEVAHLMKVLPDDRMGLSIRLLLGTGMRMQELLALEPQFIEEDGSVIHIRQAVKVVKGTVSIGSPKSKDSIRDIPVPLNVRPCAIKLRDTTDQFIWESPKTGLPCNPTHFRDVFRKSLEEAGDVRLLTPHSCRHTYVSQMQALGVDIQTIQSIVGHADTEMTEHYLHVQESIRQSAIQLFSEAFSA